MKIVWFAHAVSSCWNNGNAHFLRGLALALQALGHDVRFYEPRRNWCERNLVHDHGPQALDDFRAAFPALHVTQYDSDRDDVAALTQGADLVVVHEWNPPALVSALGRYRVSGAPFTLLFQDTHHRAATAPDEMKQCDLSGYDGVLAFGNAIAEIYRRNGWARRVWTFHEAADTQTFYPQPGAIESDLVWIGNWGDEERTAELQTFLLDPASALHLRTDIYGVRYPEAAKEKLMRQGFRYRGWLPNHRVPAMFGRSLFTVHVPRRPYARALPGIPTIRVFEALACGIPLISAPWDDVEELFPKDSYLTARTGAEMQAQMRALLADSGLRKTLRENGLAAIRSRHSCTHRAQELLRIYGTCNAVEEAA